MVRHKVLDERHVEHHGKEGQQGEDDEVFHARGEHLRRILILGAPKDKGLVGIAERLCQQAHDHGNLDASAVDAELHKTFFSRHQTGVGHLVEGLAEIAHNTKQQDGPGIMQHTPGQLPAETVGDALYLVPEAEHDDERAQQVGKEDEAHAVVVPLVERLHGRESVEEQGKDKEDDEVKDDVDDDKQQLECHELYGTMLLAQIAEEDSLKGIHRADNGKAGDILRVCSIAHRPADGVQQAKDKYQKQYPNTAHQPQGGAEHHARVLDLLVCKAEVGGFHAEGKQHEQQGRPGVEVADDAVASAFSCDFSCVKGYEQVVEKAADDAAEAVDGRVLSESFQICHKKTFYEE